MAPRYLNDDEIESIVNTLPKVTAGIIDVANKIRDEIINIIRLQLRDYKLEPKAIDEFKKIYRNQFVRSIIEPGEPIGITAGEATGGPMTQLNLNTFHQAGSSKTISIDTFRELFSGVAYRKDETTTVHFKNKNLSFEEVLEYTREIVGVSISSLLNIGQIFKTKNHTFESWYEIYELMMEKKFDKSKYFLRLKFNPDLLYKYKVTLNDIVHKLENNVDEKCLNCIASPLHIGIIDVFTIEKVIKKSVNELLNKESSNDDIEFLSDSKLSLIFLQQIVYPNLHLNIIKGIYGIKKLFPISSNILFMIINTEKIADTNDEWVFWLDLVTIRSTGIPLSKIYGFLESANIQILNKKPINVKPNKIYEDPRTEFVTQKNINIKVGKDYFDFLKIMQDENKQEIKSLNNKIKELDKDEYVKEHLDKINILKEKKYSPFDYLKYKISEEDKKIKQFVKEEKAKNVIYPVYNYSDFYRYSTYVYAEIIGYNLKKLLSLEIIDSSSTISNSPYEMLSTFGIESTRNFIALNFYNLIKISNSFINSRYIYLIADFMTNKGVITSITPKGVSAYNRGAFAEASFQSPLENFVKSAISGKKENVSSTSTCIFFGKRMPIGTGLPQFSLIEEVLDELKKTDISRFEELTFSTSNLKNNVDKIKIKDEKIIFGDEDKFDIKILKLKDPNKLFNSILNDKQNDSIKLGGNKGPIPSLTFINNESDNSYNSIIKKILNLDDLHKKHNLPKLGNKSFNEILDDITSNIKNNEKNVDLIKISDFISNSFKYKLQ